MDKVKSEIQIPARVNDFAAELCVKARALELALRGLGAKAEYSEIRPEWDVFPIECLASDVTAGLDILAKSPTLDC